MGALFRLLGLGLIIFAGYNLFVTFETQIISEAVQTQTPDFLDFFIESATPDPTQVDIQRGVIYFIVLIVGIVLLIK